MSALSDYVRELKRQRSMLEDASERDDLAIDLICLGMRERPTGCRRIWTRQDKNRLACQIAIEEAESAGRPLLFDIPECNTRQRTRMGWVLGRLEKQSIRQWHQRALDESRIQGTYAVIAPLIIEATAGHEMLIAAYREGTDDWNPVMRQHDKVVANLEMHLIDAAKSCQDPAPSSAPTSSDRPSPLEHENEHAAQPFTGGKMAFYADRVELCGVDICSGQRSSSRRIVLELLSQKRGDGIFVPYSGNKLENKLARRGGQGTAAGSIRDLRDEIMDSLRSQAGLVSGRRDVILSGGPGYRFAESVNVHFVDPPRIMDITDIDGSEDVPNVPDGDVRNDEAARRRTWIIQQLESGVQLKAPMVTTQFKRSKKTAQRDLDALRDDGKVEFVGDPRTGYYRLCEPPETSK